MAEISINTTQNVDINFSLANVGQRMGAFLIDLLLKFCYVYFISAYFLPDTAITALEMDQWSVVAIYIIFYLPVIFYSLVQESLMEGQTVGKKLLSIRVVKIDGYQAEFMDYLIRWVMRLIDGSGTMCLAGFISVVATKNHQRLGDLAAGTAVISLKNNINISHTILEKIDDDYIPKYKQVILFSDNDMRIIKETYQTCIKSNDTEKLAKLIQKIETVANIKQVGSPSKFITTIIKDYNYYTGS